MNDSVRPNADEGQFEFDDGRGVKWKTGIIVNEQGRKFRWFRSDGRRERRYELRNGEAKDTSMIALRAQLHASVVMK